MHGCERENRNRIRHMRSAPTRGVTTTKTLPTDSIVSTSDSFYKDGRKISVGDCALFEPPQNHPPFIGIIRWLSNKKDKDNSNKNNLVLGVSWLYRPSELELGKGVPVDAEPNEIFYSFHKDEIPAASLLHPCKVAFLPKDVQLSPGISSFICRQVYDIANNCLWWLTDRDFIDERQEEVDKLLYKTRIEMHATVQPGGRSPKPLSVNTSSASQLKPVTDNNVQSSSTSYPSQVKRKKREHRDHGSDPSKPERSSKSEDSESAQFKSESLKSEIAKITEKGGLVSSEGVEKLVQLMQPNREEMNNVDLYSRSMLAGVIAATDRFDCLSWFVELRGLPVLDEWLQDIHQGRIGDGSSRKNGGDKSAEEFLFVLLRALDKLPVNLQALQMCNIGRSVNHLRTNKNVDIQKKARSLVDTWKKRVEAEMNSIDSKSTRPVSWSSKSRIPEVSHSGSRHAVGSAEPPVKSPVTQVSASKTSSSVKPATANIPNAKSASSSPRQLKESGKDAQYPRISVPDVPSATKEERSSSSSQSHNCSQSFSGKEDARSSTAGSITVNKSTPQHPKVTNGIPGPSPAHRETGLSKTSSHRTSSPSCDKAVVPVVEGNSKKLIVKIPNRVRSPAQSGSEDRKDSSALHVEKRDELVTNSREKSDVNGDYFQSDEFKAILNGCDEGAGSPPREEEKSKVTDDAKKSSSVSKAAKLNDASFSSMKALIESCAKFSETNTSLSSGDDIGIKLLASVAAEEISMSDHDSPTHSPQRNAPVPDKSELSPKDILARTESQRDNRADNDNGDRKILSAEPAPRDPLPNTEPIIETSEKLIDSNAAPASVSEKRENVGDKATVSMDTNVDSTQTDTKPILKSSLLVKDENPAMEVSPSSNLSANEGSKTVDERCNTGNAEQKLEHRQETRNEMLQSPISARNLGPEVASRPGVIKSEEPPDMRSPRAVGKAKFDSDVLKDIANQALVGSLPAHKNQKTEYMEEKMGNHVLQGGAEPYGRSKKSKLSGAEAEETGETAGVSLFSDTKVKFDLNEGFVVDDMKYGEPVKVSPVPGDHLPYPVSSSVSVSLPASITVAAAAKRPFLPPEDLRRSKGELGWKGSAATSAFRPAEPRKIQEPTTATPSSSKQSRPMLDFDLNAPGDELADDMDTGSAPARGSGGGLDLDLNQADETNDTEQQLFMTSGSSSNRGLDFSLAPIKQPLPSASASASGGGFSRDFDLNNGPAFDDTSTEPLFRGVNMQQQSQALQPHLQPAMAGMRINTVEMGNFSSWFTPGGSNTNGSPVVVPSMLPNRGGEKHFPGGPQIIAATPQQQRILGSGPHFSPDVYWGSVLPTSSPNVPFSSTPFQYPVFPFGPTFPLPSTSGGAAAYMDTSTGGRICFPTIQGPPGGPGGSSGGGPPSQYPRPYMISNAFLEANNHNNNHNNINSNSGGVMDNSRKWSNSRQGGLDLNAGPGVVDVDGGREDVYAQRQFSFVSPQALKEEQARMLQAAAAAAAAGGGGVMKRKEPEGGWDMDGYRYKQSSRQ